MESVPAGRGKKILTAVLIVANVLVLVMLVVTVLPNIRRAAGWVGAPASFEPTPFLGAGDLDEEMGDESLPDAGSERVGENGEAEAPGTGFSTDERPELDEFMWYLEGVYQDGVPSGAVAMDKFKYTTGGWKGLIVYDPEGDSGESTADFLNVRIAGTADELSLTLDWYLMVVSGEAGTFDETDVEDTVFKGKWEDGGLWASGPGTIRLTHFYELKGKQYAIGTVDTPDGVPAVCALVRP